jgi:hypothetical protein
MVLTCSNIDKGILLLLFKRERERERGDFHNEKNRMKQSENKE